MTWSIVARDDSGALGIAIASRFFAVGALCPYGRGGVGALATQALVNPLYGARGLEALAHGEAPMDIVRTLTSADAGRDHRQVHIVDATGRVAAHTGHSCIAWCGHLAGDGWSVAGNMLAGAQVLDQTAAAYTANTELSFAERLIAALQAGEDAGGDKRGKQAAAVRIFTTEEYPALDLRVDDHADPLAELRRLLEISLERYQPFVSCLASRESPAGITDRERIEAVVTQFQLAQKGGRR